MLHFPQNHIFGKEGGPQRLPNTQQQSEPRLIL